MYGESGGRGDTPNSRRNTVRVNSVLNERRVEDIWRNKDVEVI